MDITDANPLEFHSVEVSIILRDKFFKERGGKAESTRVIPYTLFQMEPYNPADQATLLECIFALLNDSEHPMFDDDWKERSLSVGDAVAFPDGAVWECQDCGWGLIK